MHSTPDPSHVRFTGPLTRFASGLAEELVLLGYTATSATAQMQLAAHLSRWLESQGLRPGDPDGAGDRAVLGRPPGHLHQPLLVAGAGSGPWLSAPAWCGAEDSGAGAVVADRVVVGPVSAVPDRRTWPERSRRSRVLTPGHPVRRRQDRRRGAGGVHGIA